MRTSLLRLYSLEERAVPASVAYAPLTQTLTVTSAASDQILVSAQTSKPAGYITVATAADGTIFDADAQKRPVRNLIFRCDGADQGNVFINPLVYVPGNLSVFGAKAAQQLSCVDVTVGGSFVYKSGAPNANDSVALASSLTVGGNLTLNLGAGTNAVNHFGGFVGGSLTMTSTGGATTVNLMAGQDLYVGGNMAYSFVGTNSVSDAAGADLTVGGNFTYTGGANLLKLGQGSVQVGGKLAVNLGVTPNTSNSVQFEALSVGGGAVFNGGPRGGSLYFDRGLSVGASLAFNMDKNFAFLTIRPSATATPNRVGGNFTYRGGPSTDEVVADDVLVGGNLNVNLGPRSVLDKCRLGSMFDKPIAVHGNVRVAAGTGSATIELRHLRVGNGLAVTTGDANDDVFLRDSSIAGPTRFDLGAGDDTLLVALGFQSTDQCSFGGTFVVLGGIGHDQVNFSDDSSNTTWIHFGGRVVLVGGGDDDTLVMGGPNVFALTGNFEDFENGPTLP